MPQNNSYDAIIVGSGPNGLAAAITLARAGQSVLVYEAREGIGGGMRSAELTLPGYIHDICSAVHPLALSSPFFRTIPLAEHGVEWAMPPKALAHPLDDAPAVLVECSLEATGETLEPDAAAYRRLLEPFVNGWGELVQDLLAPLGFPRHPLLMARFGLPALRSAAGLAKRAFRGERARAMFAGMAAHSMLPLEKVLTAGFGLTLNVTAHAVGWPIARGGSQQIANALASYLYSLKGEIITGHTVTSLDELPPARAILLDLTPRQILRLAGDRFPGGYRRQLERYRYGPGTFKVDWALSDPIPWIDANCLQAATVHVGGSLEEIAASERAVWEGVHIERPFVLLAQQSLFDSTRAPAGKHTAWAYCHVPHGSSEDMCDRIEAQIERFAPGFRDCILARAVRNSVEYEQYNPNFVGGDINGGVQDLFQFYTRPAIRLNPYTTPAEGLYICSSATPPGGGVHGMCGYFAAQTALKKLGRA